MTDGRDEELYADRSFRPGPPPELREPPRRRSRALGVFVATFALAAFAGVVWYAYDQGLQRGTESSAPLIRADPNPIKVRPEQPGGLEVPNQDKLVYEAMRPGSADANRVERLLPPPERPVDPPAPPMLAPSLLPPAPPLPVTQPTGEATVPIEESQPTAIPPARIVTPAPAPSIPRPEEPPAPPPAPPMTLPSTAAEPSPAPVPAPAPPPPPAPVAQAPAPAAAPPPSAPPPSAPPPASPAPSAPAAGNFRIQLGALREEAAAETEWARLKRRYPEELGALDRRIQRVDLGAERGVFYRIQSSGVSEAAADRICAGLKAKGQACLVVRP